MSFDLSKTLKEIRQLEATAERFYSLLLKELKDKKVISNLTHVRNDERNHVKWVQEMIEYAEKKKVPTVTKKEKPIKGIVLAPGVTNLLITKTEKWFTGVLSILNALKGKSVAYIALNRPVSILKKNFEEASVDIVKIDFAEVEATKSLTDISIAVTKAKKPIVILDNVSALAVYNPPGLVIKFLRSVAEKAVRENFAVIFVIMENEAGKSLIDPIKEFTDNIIRTK